MYVCKFVNSKATSQGDDESAVDSSEPFLPKSLVQTIHRAQVDPLLHLHTTTHIHGQSYSEAGGKANKKGRRRKQLLRCTYLEEVPGKEWDDSTVYECVYGSNTLYLHVVRVKKICIYVCLYTLSASQVPRPR